MSELNIVVFAICLQNWKGFNGFVLDSAFYSAHPDEKQVVLMEGIRVFVVRVEDILIDNSLDADIFWKDLNHKTITVIYLFHNE